MVGKSPPQPFMPGVALSDDPLPWMKVWVNDFIARTVAWPGVASGLYAQLMILEWAIGPLPDDAAQLASILKYDSATFATVWPIVRPVFGLTADGRLVNHALEAERADAYELRKKMSVGGKNGAKGRWKGKQRNSQANAEANGHANTPLNGAANGAAHALQHQLSAPASDSNSKARVKEEQSAHAIGPSKLFKPPPKGCGVTTAELEEAKRCRELAAQYVEQFPDYEDVVLARMAQLHPDYIRDARLRRPAVA